MYPPKIMILKVDFAIKHSNYTTYKRFICLKWILKNSSTILRTQFNYLHSRSLPLKVLLQWKFLQGKFFYFWKIFFSYCYSLLCCITTPTYRTRSAPISSNNISVISNCKDGNARFSMVPLKSVKDIVVFLGLEVFNYLTF